MAGEPNIRAIGQERDDGPAEDISYEPQFLDEQDVEQDWTEENAPRRLLGWLWPIIILSAIAGWTVFFAYTYREIAMSGGPFEQWAALLSSWSLPVLLLTTVWLLTMRNSEREAARFGTIAASLSTEAERLEDRLNVINRELSLAREFLHSQSRELDTMGRLATERLSEHADDLNALIETNGDRIDAIATVSTTALDNMGRLRDDLPVIANSAKDVSNQIGTAGMTAHTHIAELVAGFGRLNDFGKASENQVDAIQTQIEIALASFEARLQGIEERTEERFGDMHDRNDALRADLDKREVEALAAIGRRADNLGKTVSAQTKQFDLDAQNALQSVQDRIDVVGEKAKAVNAALREGQDEAITIWSGRIEQLKARLTGALEEIHRIDEQSLAAANGKLDALRSEAEAIDASIADREAHLAAKVGERRAALTDNEEEALALLTTRFEALDGELGSRFDAQRAHIERLNTEGDAMTRTVIALGVLLHDTADQAHSVQANIVDNADAIETKLQGNRDILVNTDGKVRDLTEACVRLLELVQASAQHSNEELPSALSNAEDRLERIRKEAIGLEAVVTDTLKHAGQLNEALTSAEDNGKRVLSDIDSLGTQAVATTDKSRDTIDGLTVELAKLRDSGESFATEIAQRLESTIAALDDAARLQPSRIANELHRKITGLANSLASESSAVLQRSLEESVGASIDKFENALENADLQGRGTIEHLRDQLADVDRLAGNLEHRVIHAREQLEERVDSDFARRMALLTESLNSHAIDITKMLSTDVSDTAWAAYLKGDRGIFTRRAIRLLDNTEARDIADLYAADHDFRENVSRYIHDFEAMLRSLLSTRDGNALGVTILGSDMGKLYVALAQAIERLRD
ncbi:MAG: ATPase [Pontixanthobacter sp.]